MSDSKSGSEIPPLIPGTTNYPKWMENIPDLLKTNKCGDIFIMPGLALHAGAPETGSAAEVLAAGHRLNCAPLRCGEACCSARAVRDAENSKFFWCSTQRRALRSPAPMGSRNLHSLARALVSSLSKIWAAIS